MDLKVNKISCSDDDDDDDDEHALMVSMRMKNMSLSVQ